MATYKPERPVTSAKIGEELCRLWDEKYADYRFRQNKWTRKFKRRLPESRRWIRGFEGSLYNSSAMCQGVAISNEDDTKLEKVYLVADADRECKSLGVLEVILAHE